MTNTDEAGYLNYAKQVLKPDEFEHFVECRQKARHFAECIRTKTPSPLCSFTDPEKNLEWCELGLEIENGAYEDYMQRIATADDPLTSPSAGMSRAALS
jgi:hypothetical protein